MSNHSGSYMLNALMTEIVDLGMTASLTVEQHESLLKILWRLCREYDCNWGEIIDPNLAKSLGVCAYCGERNTELDEYGHCNNHPNE